jgi:acyl-coenzyme A thioesterase PaaI-like protein
MPGGEEVEVRAKVIKVGATIATIHVELYRRSTGTLVATGTHVKYLNKQSKLPSKL